jgi:hypothetical protein
VCVGSTREQLHRLVAFEARTAAAVTMIGSPHVRMGLLQA